MAGYLEYYETLGIGEGATTAQVRSAYRRAARAHHPDLNPGDAGAADRFKRVREAYEALSDPNRRAIHVRRAAGESRPQQGSGSYTAAWGSNRWPSPPGAARLGPDVLEALLLLRAFAQQAQLERRVRTLFRDRKSTRLNSSHGSISYAVFCL